MNPHGRTFALVELGALFSLWTLTVWGAWQWSGVSVWTFAGILGLGGTVLCSLMIRRPGWKDSGFRLDNFWPALVYVGGIILCLLVAFAVTAGIIGLAFPPLSGKRIVSLLVSGVLQQAFFLGYLFHRWTLIFRKPSHTVLASAASFALIHLPDSSLVAATAIGGIFLGWLFLQAKNVIVLGLAHGFVVLFIISVLQERVIIKTTQIGPAELAPLAATVARELKPGDRIGFGPHGIGAGQFGRTFEVEPIGASDLDDRLNREQLQLFFAANGRVFCAITESDFYHYLEPELRERMFLLDTRYVWKRKLALNRAFLEDFFYGSDDVPVLGAFRDRVLLVSNRRPHGAF